MKVKTLVKIAIVLGIMIATIPYAEVRAQSASLWKFTNSLLQPVVNSWNVYAPVNLRFDGEIQPDGTTCANGEILKRTGANDWDCAADNTGGGGSNTTTTLAGISGDVLLATTSLYSNNAIYFTTSSQTITLNYPRDLDIIATIATSTGSLIVGSSTNWVGLAVGSDNTCLIASSTGFQNGIGWGSCSGGGGDGGITSLNGLVGLTQTFATSTLVNGGFQITSAGSAHTFKISEILDRIAVLATSTNQILVATGLPTAWASQDASTLLYLPGFITGTSSAFTTPLGVSTSLYLPGFITGTSSAFTTPLGVSTSLYLPGFITATSSAFATPLGVSTSLYLPGFITATSSAFTTPTGVSTSVYLPGFITATSTDFQKVITFPIPVASTSLVASSPITLTTNTLSLTTSTGSGLANVSGLKLALGGDAAQTCGGTDKVSSVSATGTITCTTDATGVGSANTTTTSDFAIYSCSPKATSTTFVIGNAWYQPVVYDDTNSIFNPSAWAFANGTSSEVNCQGHLPIDFSPTSSVSLLMTWSATTTAAASSSIDINATSVSPYGGSLNPTQAQLVNLAASTTPLINMPTVAGNATTTQTTISGITLNADNRFLLQIRRWGQAAGDTLLGDLYLHLPIIIRAARVVN